MESISHHLPPALPAHAQQPTASRRNEDRATPAEEPVTRKSAPAPAASLSEEELRQVEELKARDREVRAHERAHAAAAGSLARGAPSYSTQRGPDGRMYAIGGEVEIDTSPVAGDPQATLHKAMQIRRAALAPANPSAQDRAVAAEAASMAAEARMELASQRLSGGESNSPAHESAPSEPTESGVRCAACGASHGAGSRGDALASHVASAISPDTSRGQRINLAV